MISFDDYGGGNAIQEMSAPIKIPPVNLPPTDQTTQPVYNDEPKESTKIKTYEEQYNLDLDGLLTSEKQKIYDKIRELEEKGTNTKDIELMIKDHLKGDEHFADWNADKAAAALEQKEKDELQEARDYENTAYQRSIADMKAAGWNTDAIGAQAGPQAGRLDTSRSEGDKERKLKLKMLYQELEVAERMGDKDRAARIAGDIMKLGGSLVNSSIQVAKFL